MPTMTFYDESQLQSGTSILHEGDSCSLTDNEVVNSFADGGNSDYGTVVLETITNGVASYGSKYVFKSSALGANTTIRKLSSTTFALLYRTSRLYMKFGTKNGDGTLSFGSEYEISNTQGAKDSTFELADSNLLVILFRDQTLGQARATAATLSGLVPTFGTIGNIRIANPYQVGLVIHSSTACTAIVVDNLEALTSQYLAFSGNSITFPPDSSGNKTIVSRCDNWGAISTPAVSVSPTKFVVFYTTSGKLRAKIGTVSGGDDSYGSQIDVYTTANLKEATRIAAKLINTNTMEVVWAAGASAPYDGYCSEVTYASDALSITTPVKFKDFTNDSGTYAFMSYYTSLTPLSSAYFIVNYGQDHYLSGANTRTYYSVVGHAATVSLTMGEERVLESDPQVLMIDNWTPLAMDEEVLRESDPQVLMIDNWTPVVMEEERIFESDPGMLIDVVLRMDETRTLDENPGIVFSKLWRLDLDNERSLESEGAPRYIHTFYLSTDEGRTLESDPTALKIDTWTPITMSEEIAREGDFGLDLQRIFYAEFDEERALSEDMTPYTFQTFILAMDGERAIESDSGVRAHGVFALVMDDGGRTLESDPWIGRSRFRYVAMDERRTLADDALVYQLHAEMAYLWKKTWTAAQKAYAERYFGWWCAESGAIDPTDPDTDWAAGKYKSTWGGN